MYTGWSRIHGTEMSINEDMELPQGTEEVLPLKSERAHMFSVVPDAVAQPATVEGKKGLPRNSSSEPLISADEMAEIEVEKPKLCVMRRRPIIRKKVRLKSRMSDIDFAKISRGGRNIKEEEIIIKREQPFMEICVQEKSAKENPSLAPSFTRRLPFKQLGQSFLTPDAFSLVGPYESNLETQFNRAHCRIIRQSSSPLVSSQIGRRPTHAVMTKPLRPTVTVLPPLMTIHHCVCKATVSCLGSDLVHSSGQTIVCRTGTKDQTLNKR
ncbi:uncharacterized protein TNCV_4559631 [Trichonephila clavipes]|nr:uncharacterized protein TNCV_4559631 [Trichonephila clavipes]